FVRGDERKADTNRVMQPGVPKMLCWDDHDFLTASVRLPKSAAFPDKREFVIQETLAASKRALDGAEKNLTDASNRGIDKLQEAELAYAVAEAQHESLLTVLRLEQLDAQRDSAEWQQLASTAATLQKKAALLEAKLKLHQAIVAERAAQPKDV